MKMFEQVVNGIQPLDDVSKKKAQQRLDGLVKPIGSLGRLEDIAAQLAGITGKLYNEIHKKVTIVMAADNGIYEEQVSPAPQEVTVLQTGNFFKGITGINVLSKHAGADIRVVDIGIKGQVNHPQLIQRKIRQGTSNMVKGPAMTREEAIEGIEVGIEMVEQLVNEGYELLGTGEMGIGNTSSSSAIISAFTGCSVDESVGKGAGLTEAQYAHKKGVIKQVLEINQPTPDDPLDVLAKVGGFDIAGMVGCFLGSAYYRVPIVIDGFISMAAALTAYKINPLVKGYMIPSHCSAEPGFQIAVDLLGIEPMLNLNMRLGEGSGCPLAFQLIEAAAKIICDMGTFTEGNIDDSDYVDIR